MSRSIDEKVVEMRFNNRQFAQGVDETLKYVDELNKGLKFEGASKGLEEVNKEVQKLDMSGFDKSVDVVITKMQTLGTIGATIVQRLTNAVLDFGKKTVDAFAIEPVTTGFNEYQLKMGSVQTIMSATGESVKTVNKYLDELNEYSDRTIYSFADMTSNIGKFTNAGVSLKDSVAAIKGVSNEAALAGANANEASRAMYNFAQALSSGSVKLIDWKSIENANMATVQFKEELLRTAEEMGTVARDASGMYQVLTTNAGGASMKQAMNATRNFNDSLSYQWMTSEVLIETLKKYSDETLEIGQKAYAAAQDVKTFSMMVDTLKEAAQSGWAETWQYIIGDFEEAKSTWTEFTSFFDDIIGRSAEARNALIGNAMQLQNDDGLTGREALWKSLLNAMTAVRDIIRAVKQAWEDIFPPITDQRLRGIIESIYNFSQGLKMTDEQLEKVRATFRGLFAIIDMFITIIRFAFRVATNLVVGFARVLQTVLFAGFALLLQWIERIKTAETGFNGWINKIARGLGNFVEYVKSLGGFSITNLFKAMFAFGSNYLNKLLDPNSVFSLLRAFVSDIGVILYGMVTNAENIEGKTRTLIGRLLTFLVIAKDKIVEVVSDLAHRLDFSKVSLQHVAIFGIAIGLAAITMVFTKFVKSITGIFSSISGVFNSISGVFKSFSNHVKADTMYTIAKAITALVASLAILMILADDKESLYVALAVLGALAAGFVGIAFAMSKMKSGNQTVAFAAAVISFGLTIKMLAQTLKTIQDIADDGLKKPLAILTLLVGEMLAVAMLMGSAKKQYTVGATTMLAFVMSLHLMIGVLKRLDETELLNIKTSLLIIYAIAGALALVGVGFKNVRLGAAASMLASVLVIKQLIKTIAEFREFDNASINKALKAIIVVFGTFAVVMVAAGLANRSLQKFEEITGLGRRSATKSSTNLIQLAAVIISMSISLNIIAMAFKAFNKFSDEELKRAYDVTSKILLVFGAITALSFFAGANADKAGKMISKMSWSIMLLVGVMALMTLFDDPTVFNTPLKVISVLMVLMGLIVGLTALVPNSEHLASVFKGISVAIMMLAAAVAAMTFLPDLNALMQATKALTIIMLAFAAVVAASGQAGKIKAVLFVLTGIVIVLAAIVAGLAVLNVEAALNNTIALSGLMLAMAATLKLLEGVEAPEKGIMTKMYAMLGIVFLLSDIIMMMDAISTVGGGLTTQIQNVVAIGILLTSMALTFKILDGVPALGQGVMTQMYAMLGVMTVLAGVLGILSALDNQYGIRLSIMNAISIGVLLNALALSFRVLQGATQIDWMVIAQLGILIVFMGIMATIIGDIVKASGDVQISIETAFALVMLLNGLALACKTTALIGPLGWVGLAGIGLLIAFIAGMGLLMLAIGEMVRENPNAKQDLDNAIMFMSKIGYGLGALIGEIINGVFQSIDLTFFTDFGEDLNGCLIALQPALDTMESMDVGTFDKLEKLGSALLALTAAELLDNINRWLMGGSTLSKFGNQLSTIGTGLVSFTEITSDIKMGDHVDYALDLMTRLSDIGKQLPNSGGLLGAIVGNNDMDEFGKQLKDLAKGLYDFCDKVEGIKYGNDVENAILVMKKLAQASMQIPNTGGLLGKLIGNNDMGDFAKQMPDVANGIVSFCEKTVDLKYSTKTILAINTLKALAEASDAIPNMGGALARIIGDNKLDKFAEQMPIAGEGIYGFCDNIDGLKVGHVDDAISTLKKLAEASQDIENTGGLAGAIFGETDMMSFGSKLTWLGYYLWVYSTWIDKISDYGIMQTSIEMVEALKDLAIAVTGVNIDKFYAFGAAVPEFAQALTENFQTVVDQSKMKGVGESIGKKIIEGLNSTREKFAKSAYDIVNRFVSAVEFKMDDRSILKNTGKKLGEKFLEGLEEGLDVNSPSGKTKWIGEMSILGFINGVTGGKYEAYDAGVSMGDSFMDGVQKRLDIHSPAGEGNWLGQMTIQGFTDGLSSGFNNLLNQFDGLWGKMQSLSADGISGIKDIIGQKSLWDFSADIGDNLVNMKDKLKDWLGFGDVGGLSDLFGFGNLSEELEEQIKDSIGGIQEGLGDVANQMTSGGGSGSISSLAEALKLSLHKHFDSKEFIYLGQQIGEGMAIAANNAIVSQANAMGDTLAEVIAITGGGLETWKAWLENRKKYDQIAQKDELAGWTLIQKMYEQGTKERMEADQEVYALQKELVKGTFEYSKKWIDTEKYYERLTLQEELEAWERIQARYLEGSDERIEAEKEVFRIKKEIRQKDYEDAKKWIDQEKKYERLSLADELAAYLRIRKTTEEGSNERLEMDEKVYDLQKQIYEAQKQYTADVESAQAEAAEARAQLEQEYADKVLEINERLADDISRLNEDYANQVDQRRKSLYSAYGLFDAVKQEDYDKDELMQNLEDQVRAFEEWQMTINNLASRGLDKGLIDELTEMGPSAAGQIRALNDMTDAELGQYNLLWSEKSSMAREQAISELEDLRVQTSDNIAKLQQESAQELDDYRETWAAAMRKITEDCDTKLEELRKDFGETVGTIKKDTEAKMKEMVAVSNQILREAGWTEAGEQIAKGIANGITWNATTVAKAMVGLAKVAITAFNQVMQIKSPSKVMEESGGYVGEGLVRGLSAYYDRAYESGNTLAEEIQNGALQAIRYVNDLVQNGMDSTFTITPVVDLTNVRAGIGDMDSMLDTTRALHMATSANLSLDNTRDISFINPNENVVRAIQSLQKDVGTLGDRIENMQVMLDTGAVVGEITAPLDAALGSRIIRNTRERG